MYQLPDNNKDPLYEQYQSGFPLIPTVVCRKCCIISEQVEAIEFLNGQIQELTTTIEKWRNIRSLEKEIDVSYSYLDTTIDNGNLLNTSDLYETEPISGKAGGITIPYHEPDPPNNTEDAIEMISKQFNRLQVTDMSTNTSDQPNTFHNCLSDVSSELMHLSKSESTVYDELKSIDNTFVDRNLHQRDIINLSVKPSTNVSSFSEEEVSKFQPNNFVKTMFVGDRTIERIHISQSHIHPERVFKIAKPHADIKQLTKDVEFFIDKLHKGATSLVFQLGFQNWEY